MDFNNSLKLHVELTAKIRETWLPNFAVRVLESRARGSEINARYMDVSLIKRKLVYNYLQAHYNIVINLSYVIIFDETSY